MRELLKFTRAFPVFVLQQECQQMYVSHSRENGTYRSGSPRAQECPAIAQALNLSAQRASVEAGSYFRVDVFIDNIRFAETRSKLCSER